MSQKPDARELEDAELEQVAAAGGGVHVGSDSANNCLRGTGTGWPDSAGAPVLTRETRDGALTDDELTWMVGGDVESRWSPHLNQ